MVPRTVFVRRLFTPKSSAAHGKREAFIPQTYDLAISQSPELPDHRTRQLPNCWCGPSPRLRRAKMDPGSGALISSSASRGGDSTTRTPDASRPSRSAPRARALPRAVRPRRLLATGCGWPRWRLRDAAGPPRGVTLKCGRSSLRSSLPDGTDPVRNT